MIDLLREYWDLFLFDTLLWTGALIALVMLVRRPVARHFGAGAAYALWFLPLARLLAPPVTLPAWMRPAEVAPMADPVAAVPAEVIVLPVAPADAPVVAPATTLPSVDFVTPLLALWAIGALAMLVRRFWLYFRLRQELLADARPVGEVDSIRLVETEAISGPMAFGVLDRVIALPMGFMASQDRQQRDLAIEHEVAHHKGGDLIMNMAVQPLFAIHWFNPLGWVGWRALRRDQEAFCDARVVSSCSQEERVAYADIIADFARRPALAPRPALAAPMACPVLGDKSIIHRLRSLSMTDISPRRRLLGRGALASAFLAVPLTASVAYAEDVPALFLTGSQEAVSEWTEQEVVEEARDEELATVEVEIERELADAEREIAEAERAIAQFEVEMERAEELQEVGKRRVRYTRQVRYNGKDWDELSEEERAEVEKNLEDVRIAVKRFPEDSELREEIEEVRARFAENGEASQELRVAVLESRDAMEAARKATPTVIMECKSGDEIIFTEKDEEGRTKMFVCEANAQKIAVRSLQIARDALANTDSLTDEQRSEALEEIDSEIAKLKSET